MKSCANKTLFHYHFGVHFCFLFVSNAQHSSFIDASTGKILLPVQVSFYVYWEKFLFLAFNILPGYQVYVLSINPTWLDIYASQQAIS